MRAKLRVPPSAGMGAGDAAAALILMFFVVPLLYLFWVSLHAASQTEIYGRALTLGTTRLQRPVLSRDHPAHARRRRRDPGACLLLGYPVAYFVALLPPRRRARAAALLLLPLMVSNVVRAYGWVAILGRRGVVNTGLRDRASSTPARSAQHAEAVSWD